MRPSATRAVVVIAGALAGLGVAGGIWVALPLPRGLTAPPPLATLTLEDRNGLVLRSTRAGDGTLQRWLSLAEIDPDLLKTFIVSEDRRFYDHGGVDLRAAARALAQNVGAGRVRSGASTITMQLARMLHPSGRTWRGKAVQALWALRLEAHLSKQEILEQYLNRVPLGQGTVGIEAAAALYFNGSAARLSLGQAALLAGLAISRCVKIRSRPGFLLGGAGQLHLLDPRIRCGASPSLADRFQSGVQ